MINSIRIALAETLCFTLLVTQILIIPSIYASEWALNISEVGWTPELSLLDSPKENLVAVKMNSSELFLSQTNITDIFLSDFPSAEANSESWETLVITSSSPEEIWVQTWVVEPPKSLTWMENASGQTLLPVEILQDKNPSVSTGSQESKDDQKIPFPPSKNDESNDTPPSVSSANWANNEILIQFRETNIDLTTYVGKYQLEQIEEVNNLKTTDTISESNIAVMEVKWDVPQEYFSSNQEMSITGSRYGETASWTIDAVIEELKKDPRIKHVQRNFVYKTFSLPTPLSYSWSHLIGRKNTISSSFSWRSVPNDESFSSLWWLDNQGQEINGTAGTTDADIDYPEAMAYSEGKLGSGVIVAVLDTGIAYDHPDLSTQMWNWKECVSDTGGYIGDCIHGYDYAYDDKDPYDGFFHGTHVAGTIGASSKNSFGVAGVSPRLELMAVKVLDDSGYGDTASIIRGINFAKNNGAKVINASFGWVYQVNTRSDFDFIYYDAIASFPGLFIAAAGNNGTNYENDESNYKVYPAGFWSNTTVSGEVIIDREIVLSGEEIIPALYNVISVAATDKDDNLAYFSNYGANSVHIAAPWVEVNSTIIKSEPIPMVPELISYNNGWRKKSGSPSETWSTRSDMVVSGEIIVSGETSITPWEVLWWDTRDPYVSGESTYIEKSFSNSEINISSVKISAWCDTPSYVNDYLDIMINTGWLFQSAVHIDESTLMYQWNSRELSFNGHNGYYSEYTLYYDANNPLNTAWGFDIRIKWVTHGDGVENYGCFVNALTLGRVSKNLSYDYLDGTSMSAPHVAWAAALAWSYKPDANLYEIRNAIIGTTDYKVQLQDKVMTAGRLNLLNMLEALTLPKILSQKHTLSGESRASFDITLDQIDASPSVLVANNPDFISGNPAFPATEMFARNHIIETRSSEDGYGLWDTITRKEIAIFVAKLGWITPKSCRGDMFSDVNSSLWEACGYIEALADQAIISTSSSQYRSNDLVTRAEMIWFIEKATGNTPILSGTWFLDLDGIGDLTGYIYRAQQSGCLDSFADFLYPLDTTYRWEVYKVASCITGLDSSIDFGAYPISMNAQLKTSIGTDYRFSFEKLLPDTTYYYTTFVCSVALCSNIQMDPKLSFHTPKVVTASLSWTITSTGQLYLQWSSSSGMIFSGSTSSGQIILTNTGNAITVVIPTSGLKIFASSPWDGILIAPYFDTWALSITLSGSTLPASVIYRIGSDISPLSLSGQVATISINVTSSNGSQIGVYRSSGVWLPYIKIATCIVTNNRCTFTTDHFSLFALGIPVVPPSSWGSSSWGWGGGPSWGSPGNSLYTPKVSLSSIKPITSDKSLTSTGTQWTRTKIELVAPIKQWVIKNNSPLFNDSLSFKGTPYKIAKEKIVDPFELAQKNKKSAIYKIIAYDNLLKQLDVMLTSRENGQKKRILQSAKNQIQNLRTSVIQNELK